MQKCCRPAGCFQVGRGVHQRHARRSLHSTGSYDLLVHGTGSYDLHGTCSYDLQGTGSYARHALGARTACGTAQEKYMDDVLHVQVKIVGPIIQAEMQTCLINQFIEQLIES